MKTQQQYLDQISRAREDVNILLNNLVINTKRMQYVFAEYGSQPTAVEHLIVGARQLQGAMNLLDEVIGEHEDYLYVQQTEASSK
jgi:hypothetical protein